MIGGQEVMERTNSLNFCWRPSNKASFSTDMYGCLFLFIQCLIQFFPMPFLPKPPANRRGPSSEPPRKQVDRGSQSEKHCFEV